MVALVTAIALWCMKPYDNKAPYLTNAEIAQQACRDKMFLCVGHNPNQIEGKILQCAKDTK